MNIILAYNDVEEFAKEMERCKDLIFERTVRLTGSYRTNGAMPLTSVHFIGSFVQIIPEFQGVREQHKLVTLDAYCGQLMRGEVGSKAQKLYDFRLDAMQKKAAALGLETEAGILSLPANPELALELKK